MGILIARRMQPTRVVAHRWEQIEAAAAFDRKCGGQQPLPRFEAGIAEQRLQVVGRDAGRKLTEDAEQPPPVFAEAVGAERQFERYLQRRQSR